MDSKRTEILTDGLFTIPKDTREKPYLTGSRCESCKEVFFPRKTTSHCTHCQKTSLTDIALSRTGKVAAFTISEQAPADGFYKGRVPYAYGYVDLPDGVRILTQFAPPFDTLGIGLEAVLVIENLADTPDQGQILTYMFTSNVGEGSVP